MTALLLRFWPTTRDDGGAPALANTLRTAFAAHRWWSDAPEVRADASGELSITRSDGSVDVLDDAFMAFTDIDVVVRTLESLGPLDWIVELEGSPAAHVVQGVRDQQLRERIELGMAATFGRPETTRARIERIRADDDGVTKSLRRASSRSKPRGKPTSPSARALRARWDHDPATVHVGHVLHGGALGSRSVVDPNTLGPAVPTIDADGTSLADLRGWTFMRLRNAELRHIDASYSLTQAHPTIGHDSDVRDSRFDSSAWQGPSVYGEWSRSSFREATFREASVSATFRDCDMDRTRWGNCVSMNASFSRTTFRGAHWRRGRIHAVTFEDVSFEDVSFDGTEVSSCRFIRCVFDGATGETSTAANEFIECQCPPILVERDIDVAALIARYGRKPDES